MIIESTQFADLGIAVFRIIVGLIFVSHALPKIQDPHSTREFFSEVGLNDSLYLVYLAIGIEVILGTLLAIGLYTQMAALVLTGFMLVASYVAIIEMDKDFEGGYEVDIILLGAVFMFYLMGAGAYSVDAVIAA